MTKQDKKELVAEINKNTKRLLEESSKKLKTDILDQSYKGTVRLFENNNKKLKTDIIDQSYKSTKQLLEKNNKSLKIEILGAIDELAVATKKGFDEVHVKFDQAEEERAYLGDRLENVESGVYRLEHTKTLKTR